MASNESFRILGFMYSILSVLGSLFEVLKCVVRLSFGQVECHQGCLNSDGSSFVSYCTLSLPFCALWLMFSIFLVVGIKQRNIVLVKAHRWFLIISYAIILFVLGIANLLLRMYYKGDDIKLIQMSVVLVLIIMLVSYFVSLWIVNGVIRYVESNSSQNNTEVVVFYPEAQKNIYGNYYAAV